MNNENENELKIKELIGKSLYEYLLKKGFNYHSIDKKIIDLFKNNFLANHMKKYSLSFSKSNIYEACLSNHSKLTTANYNHNLNINHVGYVIVNNLNPKNSYDNTKLFAIELLQQILDKNIIRDNDKAITMDQLVIQDFILNNNTNENNNKRSIQFPKFHTDFSWSIFDKNTKGFQIWYLIENNHDYGNMFLYETDEIKETPYVIEDYDETTFKSKLYKNILINDIALNYKDYFDEIDIDFTKFKYLNMNNGECLVMSKHQPHSTDTRRDEKKNMIAINFRVILKNQDGSIDLNPLFSEKMKLVNNQKKIGNKLYNVDMFDFF